MDIQNNYVQSASNVYGCVPLETPITNVRLATAYVPFQKICDTFSPSVALRKGTMFPPLYNAYGWSRREGIVEDDE